MPSESPTKRLAIPKRILHRTAQSTTPPAPQRNRVFLLKNASICNPIASRYREKAEVTAAAGLSNTFCANPLSKLEEKNRKVLLPRRCCGWNTGEEARNAAALENEGFDANEESATAGWRRGERWWLVVPRSRARNWVNLDICISDLQLNAKANAVHFTTPLLSGQPFLSNQHPRLRDPTQPVNSY